MAKLKKEGTIDWGLILVMTVYIILSTAISLLYWYYLYENVVAFILIFDQGIIGSLLISILSPFIVGGGIVTLFFMLLFKR